MIMASGDQTSIMEMDAPSFSIMEFAGTLLSEVVNIYIFCW